MKKENVASAIICSIIFITFALLIGVFTFVSISADNEIK